MAGLTCSFVLMSVQPILLSGSKWTVEVLQKPSSPKSCREMCQAYTDSFNFIKEDISCRRIFAKDEKPVNRNLSSLDVKDQTKNNTSLIQDPTETVQQGYDLATQLPQLNSKATVTGHLNAGNCSHDLTQACKDGRLFKVRDHLSQSHEDINCRDEHGRTPVMLAARKGWMAVFDFLISKGCDLSATDENDDNVVHMACKGGHTDIVRKLKENEKFDLEVRGCHGRTPILTATLYCHIDLIVYLVSKGCILTAVSKTKDNILHLACYSGCVKMVRYILSKGIVSIESRGYNGNTPAMTAAYRGNTGVFDVLAMRGCNLKAVDDLGNTPSHLACFAGRAKMVRYLIALGSRDWKKKNKRGQTPVQIAKEKGYEDVVAVLKAEGWI